MKNTFLRAVGAGADCSAPCFYRRGRAGKIGFFAGLFLSLWTFLGYGYSPELVEAILMADKAGVEKLVSDPAVRAVLNKKDDYGNAALHYAAGQTEDTVQQAKREAGVKENGFKSFKEFQSAGISAQIIQILVSAGALPDEKSSNDKANTALHIAVENCDKSLITALIEAGANVNETNGSGRPPLYSAVDCADIEVAEILIKNNANVNGGATLENGWSSLLFTAVRKERWDIVDLLIRSGVSATENLHSTAWKTFVSWDRREGDGKSGEKITLILLNAGASVGGAIDSLFLI